MKLVSVSEMKAIEVSANEQGLSYAQMMENAGNGLADQIDRRFRANEPMSAIGLVGPGNNGGDCLVALTELRDRGWDCTAYLVKPREEGDPLIARFTQARGHLIEHGDGNARASLDQAIGMASVLVDGVLGTGIKLPLKPEIAEVLGQVKSLLENLDEAPVVVAVDCPSGVDCDSGAAAEETIPADLTVCMAAVKQGLLQFPAFSLAGEIVTVDIGLAEDLPEWQNVHTEVADAEMVRKIIPRRLPDSHKGTYGTALIVAGSVNFSGAAILASEGAYRIGTGLVTLAVPAPLHQALASAIPEATWLLLPHEMGVISANAVDLLRKNLGKIDAMLLGPGWGMEETTQTFLEGLIQGKSPAKKPGIGFIPTGGGVRSEETQPLPKLVVDADGLKLLAKIVNWWKILPSRVVLTPHPGEMAILTGLKTDEIQSDRLRIANKYAQEWDKVVVLKGAFTVIADPGGREVVIPVATSALAKGGTGDVLAGMITGLRAQGMEAFEAAVAGAWIHGQAGLAAAEQWGSEASVLAGDVALAIGEVLGGLA